MGMIYLQDPCALLTDAELQAILDSEKEDPQEVTPPPAVVIENDSSTTDLTNIYIASGAGLFVIMLTIIFCLCIVLIGLICKDYDKKKPF